MISENNEVKKYKILFIDRGIHHKNMKGLNMCKNLHFDFVDIIEQCTNLSDYDFVYLPNRVLDVSKYPNTKFIFGPHLSVLPNESQLNIIKGNNSVYIQPSSWAVELWKLFPCCSDLHMKPVPFAVDNYSFKPVKPIEERNEVFIYYKCRKQHELNVLIEFLKERGYSPRIFNYNASYPENEFINQLKNSKFGVWLGRHESQGFALEESLSCNVPLLVWDVRSMNQEEGNNYPDYKGTCIPYWDSTCGEYFYDESELKATFDLFISKMNTYTPREYILNHLSPEVCEKAFVSVFS